MNLPFVIDNQQHNGHSLDVATIHFSTAVGLLCTGLTDQSQSVGIKANQPSEEDHGAFVKATWSTTLQDSTD